MSPCLGRHVVWALQLSSPASDAHWFRHMARVQGLWIPSGQVGKHQTFSTNRLSTQQISGYSIHQEGTTLRLIFSPTQGSSIVRANPLPPEEIRRGPQEHSRLGAPGVAEALGGHMVLPKVFGRCSYFPWVQPSFPRSFGGDPQGPRDPGLQKLVSASGPAPRAQVLLSPVHHEPSLSKSWTRTHNFPPQSCESVCSSNSSSKVTTMTRITCNMSDTRLHPLCVLVHPIPTTTLRGDNDTSLPFRSGQKQTLKNNSPVVPPDNGILFSTKK